MLKKFFKYIENLWLGADGRMSLRAVAFIALTIDFISNMHHAVYKWEAMRTLEGLNYALITEAGFATTLLGIAAWSVISSKKLDNEAVISSTAATPAITVAKADITVAPTTAKTVNAENVQTVNTANTNITKPAAKPADDVLTYDT